MLNLKRLCVLGLLWVCPRTSAAASYYVSASGTDANAGTLSAPWKTLARASRAVLHPGDVLLLRGGDVFRDSFSVEAADAGTDANPISITAYGSGRAVIAPLSGSGISVYNAGGYRIAHLAIVGAGDAASGIVFFADVPGGVKLPSVMMDDVEVSGFGSDGIEIGSWNGATGYRNVRITRASVHGNARSGLIVYAQQPNVHEDVYIGDTRAFANSGIAGSPTNSGSGIVLGSVNRGTVERSVASGNGWLCSATEGPVGIWTYDSTFVTIQHNESYGNRTGGPADGGGFDLDQNVSHSVVQFNYSHGNAGAGYLLAQGPATSTHHSNVVRFNVSENDGRKNRYAGIELWGRVLAAEIYNNTIFVAASASGTPRAVYVSNVGVPASTPAHVHIRNNILQTDGSAPLIDVAAGVLGGSPDIRFEGNVYDPSGGAFHVLWGSSSYSSLSAWRATTQETIAGAAVGTTVDPLLTAPGSGQTAGDATKLESLRA